MLRRLYRELYQSPRLHPDDAARVLKELALVDESVANHRPPGEPLENWRGVRDRLTEFFGHAVTLRCWVRCASDRGGPWGMFLRGPPPLALDARPHARRAHRPMLTTKGRSASWAAWS